MVKYAYLFSLLLITSISAQEAASLDAQSTDIQKEISDLLHNLKAEIPPINLSLPKERKLKSPTITVLLASLFPGLGHVYLEDYTTAGFFAGGTLVGTGVGLRAIHTYAGEP